VAGARYSFCDLCNIAMGGHLIVAAITDIAFPGGVIEMSRLT